MRVQGDVDLVQFLKTLPDRIHAALMKKMTDAARDLSETIKEQYLSGQVLGIKSGRLRSSIYARAYDSGDNVILSFGSRGDVPYAAIHEYGGFTKPHTILPKAARVLAFMGPAGKTFAMSVNHPGSQMPERSYLRAALEAKIPDFEATVRSAVAEASS